MRRVGFLIILMAVATAGCGNKGWPTPAAEEPLVFSSTRALRQSQCVTFIAEVSGPLDKLAAMDILEEVDGCAGCPFSPGGRTRVQPGGDGFRQDGKRIIMTLCDLEDGAVYRWRLAAVRRNGTATLSPVLSVPASQ